VPGGSRPLKNDAEARAVKRANVPTIKDVARVAQVHYSTVSLALRDHPSIPEGTRKKVRVAAERLGYQPNPVMAALSRFRQRQEVPVQVPRIAYLVNRSREQGFGALLHQEHFLDGARQQAEALGYELELLFVAPGYHGSISLARHLRERGTIGIIIGAFEPGLRGLRLDWDEFAMVKIDSRHMDPPVPLVSNDQLQVVRLAFQRLRSLGYRRIGMAVGRADEESTDHRHAMGYLIEQSALPAADRIPPLFFPHGVDGRQVARLVGRWVRRHAVEVVLCNWYSIADLLREAGFKVPEEVACACLCLIESRVPLAGVVPNLRVVGSNAVSMLASQIRSGERGVPDFPPTTYVESVWQDGPSAPGKR
jgi:LacI family transcriptional regulator